LGEPNDNGIGFWNDFRTDFPYNARFSAVPGKRFGFRPS